MEAKHTKTPWTAVESIQAIAPQILSADGSKVIARLGMARTNEARLPSGSEANANLGFIVRACNAHDDLVKALQMIAAGHGCPAALAEDALAKAGA